MSYLGKTKRSGTVAPGSFSGNPKIYTVTFSTDLPSTDYYISVIGLDARMWSYESKTVSGFVINSNSNQALTGNVDWEAKPIQDVG